MDVFVSVRDPQTRKVVKPHDDDPARMAVLMMMRSWVRVVLLTSEDTGLPTLVCMLQEDPKVCTKDCDVIIFYKFNKCCYDLIMWPEQSRYNHVCLSSL